MGSSVQGQVTESSQAIGPVFKGTGNWSDQFWANLRKVRIQFPSGEEVDSAIDWLWESPEMQSLPRVHVGENNMIIPEEAVDLFQKKGYQFALRSVVSAGDLPPEQVNHIRREENV